MTPQSINAHYTARGIAINAATETNASVAVFIRITRMLFRDDMKWYPDWLFIRKYGKDIINCYKSSVIVVKK